MHLKSSKNLIFQMNRPLEQFVAVTLDRTAAAFVGLNRISATNFDYRLLDAIYENFLKRQANCRVSLRSTPPTHRLIKNRSLRLARHFKTAAPVFDVGHEPLACDEVFVGDVAARV